ncbi:hypothetical protein [Flavobacterium sp.]|uniref:hypothetical protein n=1 Tax=Flavobacterium sp. TaxID=239 RepID=UPI0026247995|nr:hypothetical protein [Flavobacterium sp.]
MASTKVIRKVGSYVLLHDILQGLYRINDGMDLSFYFDEETKNSLLNMREDVFIDEAKVLVELADI